MAEERKAIAARLGLEFLVVLVGILAALGVDDWRQARSDRQLEEHLLTSLAADLENDRQDAQLQETLAGRAQRLRTDPMIATHALRLRQYYDTRVARDGMQVAREALVESVQEEVGALAGSAPTSR